ncbi:hypothetical protein [Paractinoplanes toevensis]|uniref:Lipoprotein n=1 Tax=Paractinoplanes toevensis TaxID=571911 RepID=A0A919W797_9ACTN|nr:hypothetical protein [Actinoplanes toevensis]GIM94578.1 hypothetical protein Ato02nite_063710 [Actinoplanes toevensis]
MRPFFVVGVLLLAATTTGCGHDDDPVVTASASAGSASADPPGSVSCAQLAVAIDAGGLMNAGVVDGIVNASRTADTPLADAAERLDTAYRAAVAATGKTDEPDKIAAVSAAASDMSGVCADSGLQTVG